MAWRPSFLRCARRRGRRARPRPRRPSPADVTPRVTVVGLGPGAPDLVTDGTRRAIERVAVRFVRTVRHPSAHLVEPATALDHLYDQADRQADVYPAMVDVLVAAAHE